jgi:hypothetical protein
MATKCFGKIEKDCSIFGVCGQAMEWQIPHLENL